MSNISELADLIFAYYPKMRKMYRNLVSIKDIPISITQLTCLHILNQTNELSMSELASDLCMSNQQLTKVVDALAELNMVERVCNPQNRRMMYINHNVHFSVRQQYFSFRARPNIRHLFPVLHTQHGNIIKLRRASHKSIYIPSHDRQ